MHLKLFTLGAALMACVAAVAFAPLPMARMLGDPSPWLLPVLALLVSPFALWAVERLIKAAGWTDASIALSPFSLFARPQTGVPQPTSCA